MLQNTRIKKEKTHDDGWIIIFLLQNMFMERYGSVYTSKNITLSHYQQKLNKSGRIMLK
jgi:hypothetical protein